MYVKIKNILARKLFRDTATQGVQNMVTSVLNFIQLPFLLQYLGGDLFGKFVLWQAAAGLCGAIFCVQFSKAVLACAPGHADENVIVKTHLVFGLASEFGSVILFCVGAMLLNGAFGVVGFSSVVIALSASASTVLQPSSTLAAVIRISGNYALYSLVSITVSLLRLGLTLGFVFRIFVMDVYMATLVIFVIPEMVRYVCLAFLVPKKIYREKIQASCVKRRIVFWGTVQNWVDIPNAYLDRFVISWAAGPETVGQYFLLKKLGMINSTAFSPFSGSLVYEYARRINLQGKRAAISLFRRSVLPFSLASTVLLLALLATKGIWVERIFGEDAPQDSLIAIVLVAYAFQSAFTSIHPLINAAKLMADGALRTLISNGIFLAFCLVGAYFFGAIGVCFALLIQFVSDVVLKWRVIARWRDDAELV